MPAVPLSDRLAIWAGLALITILAWVYLLRMPMSAGMQMASMPNMPAGMAMAMQPQSWTLGDTITAFAMWAVMMVAMMIPSASPMVMLYARSIGASGSSSKFKVAIFVAGYIVAWTIFSAGATLIQLSLQKASLISGDLTVGSLIGGAILVLAGIYQLTPLKQVCLRHCQSPIGFFMAHWREGTAGALSMGLRHGFFCVGCCWMLMALLFVAGVMNLLWVALIAIFVLIEKVLPWGRMTSSVTGLALVCAGLWIAVIR
ncbi:MAG: DUF2182 domain-containing protein [Candidatus Binataceae bacterium]|nr:DUF2182 domain-containing protein [Candidatus Binataceae bacterium]